MNKLEEYIARRYENRSPISLFIVKRESEILKIHTENVDTRPLKVYYTRSLKKEKRIYKESLNLKNDYTGTEFSRFLIDHVWILLFCSWPVSTAIICIYYTPALCVKRLSYKVFMIIYIIIYDHLQTIKTSKLNEIKTK